jgi:hypothetical protein
VREPRSPAGVWKVEGEDGVRWSAELVLAEPGHDGHFDWKSERGDSGRELVTWTYHPDTRMLVLTGHELRDAVGQIGLGSYIARVSADGRTIANGTWGAPAVPGIWEADLCLRR